MTSAVHFAPPNCFIHAARLVGQGAELLSLAAPLHRRLDEAQWVVDVLLAPPQPVAGIGDDRDVRGADDRAVAGVAHRVVELADDPAGRLVDHRPQRRERRHVAAGEGLHRLPDPRRGPLRGPASCPPRARRRRRPRRTASTHGSQSRVCGGAVHRRLEFLERRGQLVAAEGAARHNQN